MTTDPIDKDQELYDAVESARELLDISSDELARAAWEIQVGRLHWPATELFWAALGCVARKRLEEKARAVTKIQLIV